MLLLTNDLVSKQVLSLRSNTPIAIIQSPIINPNNLKIEGFYCRDKFDKSLLVLLTQDIRETIENGYIVNDHDVLAKVEDLVRLREILNINFALIGKPVETLSKNKVGKVTDYSTDINSMFIQKLYVSAPVYKHFGNNSMMIDRTQINEITPRKIIIGDILSTVPAHARASII
jgi:sporulation protein YlmC with PRC-barrel domain